MRYVLRVSLLDRPGMLGALATALGAADVDIVAMEVIDRDDGVTVDDLTVETPVDARRLVRVCEQVTGVAVESVVEVRAARAAVSATALAAEVAESRDTAVACLVAGLPGALSSDWSVAVHDTAGGVGVLATGGPAPAVPAGLRLPFMPLDGARRLPQADWMPVQWRRRGQRLEVAVAPLHGPLSSVLVVRCDGPRFRAAELRRLGELSRVAVAVDRRPVAVVLGA